LGRLIFFYEKAKPLFQRGFLMFYPGFIFAPGFGLAFGFGAVFAGFGFASGFFFGAVGIIENDLKLDNN
jgi:hypothetical protein